MNDCPAINIATAKTIVSSALANWDISFGKSEPSSKNPIANSRGSAKFHAVHDGERDRMEPRPEIRSMVRVTGITTLASLAIESISQLNESPE
jgi:hypothetical protein